jgi:NAD(P)-dependent dehydrogenase (short-subunit alcohol dehydrogenase family)
VTPTPSLDGKLALVTGGGGGIGRGISETFAAQGARVVVVDVDETRARDTVDEIRDAGGDAEARVVDVTDDAAVRTLAHDVGDIDVLVNNVGHYLHRPVDFVDSTEEQWEALYRVNLRHVFVCCHAFLPGMIERGRGGSIVNVSTVEAFRGMPQGAVYGAFKAGVTQFTRSLALEVGAHGIRVNAVAPDLTQTLQVPYDRWVRDDERRATSCPRGSPSGASAHPTTSRASPCSSRRTSARS